MKKTWLIIFAIVSLMALVAVGCKKKEETNAGAAGTTDTSTSTAASTTTTSGTETSATTGSTANLSKDDQEFVTKAAEAGISEVNLGNLAGSKATSADVKSFASTMVTDHSKGNDELKSLASGKGITLPTGPGKGGEDAMSKLSGKSGKDFDKDYMNQAVDDHEKAVKLFEKESKDGQDPDLKNWASKTLPTLQKHLEMAKATKTKT